MKTLILQDQRQEFQFWSTQPVPSIGLYLFSIQNAHIKIADTKKYSCNSFEIRQ